MNNKKESNEELPEIAGHLDISLGEFERRCRVALGELQALPAPDTHLIAIICDAVRLKREVAVVETMKKDVIKPPAGGTYCAYCSEQFPSDNDAADQISKHIAICPKHPMRVPEEERDKAKAEVVRLRARDERWKRAVKEYYTRCLLDPHADTEMSVDAGFALKNGNLEALEKVLGIKEEP